MTAWCVIYGAIWYKALFIFYAVKALKSFALSYKTLNLKFYILSRCIRSCKHRDEPPVLDKQQICIAFLIIIGNQDWEPWFDDAPFKKTQWTTNLSDWSRSTAKWRNLFYLLRYNKLHRVLWSYNYHLASAEKFLNNSHPPSNPVDGWSGQQSTPHQNTVSRSLKCREYVGTCQHDTDTVAWESATTKFRQCQDLIRI